ncbi:hypothetical protein JVT61DRAFT_7013 [Boletus reticuloceps]|uniref:Uncharacterized protein n=1 Tax=Boletus reticuloceps TaxID=495285 RepID=A0A8I2YJZ7_9AGAM|nr:hypothetical protein JVT61DRAFT_7013 [Boletus reticuloceps]
MDVYTYTGGYMAMVERYMPQTSARMVAGRPTRYEMYQISRFIDCSVLVLICTFAIWHWMNRRLRFNAEVPICLILPIGPGSATASWER